MNREAALELFGQFFHVQDVILAYFSADSSPYFDYALSKDEIDKHWAIVPGPKADTLVYGSELPGYWSVEDGLHIWENSVLVTGGIYRGKDFTLLIFDNVNNSFMRSLSDIIREKRFEDNHHLVSKVVCSHSTY